MAPCNALSCAAAKIKISRCLTSALTFFAKEATSVASGGQTPVRVCLTVQNVYFTVSAARLRVNSWLFVKGSSAAETLLSTQSYE